MRKYQNGNYMNFVAHCIWVTIPNRHIKYLRQSLGSGYVLTSQRPHDEGYRLSSGVSAAAADDPGSIGRTAGEGSSTGFSTTGTCTDPLSVGCETTPGSGTVSIII